MGQCFVPQCSHRTEKNNCVPFRRFPSDSKKRKLWIQLVRRADKLPNRNSMICSCHFREDDDKPCVFPWNRKKIFGSSDTEVPEIRSFRRTPTVEMEYVEPENQISGSTEALKLPTVKPADFSVVQLEESATSNFSVSVHEVDRRVSSSSITEWEVSDPGTALRPTDTISTIKEHEFSVKFYEAQEHMLRREIETLKAENLRLRRESFSFNSVRDKKKVEHYTGLSEEMFDVLLQLLQKVNFTYHSGKRVLKLPLSDQLLMTLMKLRWNTPYDDISMRFGVSHGTVSNIVNTILEVLYEAILRPLMKDIPSQKKNQIDAPGCFSSFRQCRIVLDCTEIECVVPKGMRNQKLTYSSYKSKNTFKILVGVAPNGTVTYCSDAYPGSYSDRAVVEHSKICDSLKPGDLVLVDKGFLITDLLPQGVSLNMPPFLSTPQFTPAEVARTTLIARARIHVERAICRIKRYRILKLIPKNLFGKASLIVKVCASLVNFQTPILKECYPSLKCKGVVE